MPARSHQVIMARRQDHRPEDHMGTMDEDRRRLDRRRLDRRLDRHRTMALEEEALHHHLPQDLGEGVGVEDRLHLGHHFHHRSVGFPRRVGLRGELLA